MERVKSPKLPSGEDLLSSSGEELLSGANETPDRVKVKRAAVRRVHAWVTPVSFQVPLESKGDVLVKNGPSALYPGLLGFSQTSTTPVKSMERVKSPKLPSGEELLSGESETPDRVKVKRAAVRRGHTRVTPVSFQGGLESKGDLLVENGLVGVSQTSTTPRKSMERVKSPKLPSGEELLSGESETPDRVKVKRAAVRRGHTRVTPVSFQGGLESKGDLLVENGLVGVSQTSTTPMRSMERRRLMSAKLPPGEELLSGESEIPAKVKVKRAAVRRGHTRVTPVSFPGGLEQMVKNQRVLETLEESKGDVLVENGPSALDPGLVGVSQTSTTPMCNQ
ncbi:unnamed protein product [Merluccius merluccius]